MGVHKIIFFAIIYLFFGDEIVLAVENHSLHDYYKNIYKAEQLIIERDYHSAAKYFDSARATGVSMFASDAYNAALCKAMAKENQGVTVYLEMLILKGAELNFFRTRLAFNDFFSSDYGKVLESEYPKLEVKRDKQIDKRLVKRVKELVNIDQQMHLTLQLNQGDTAVLAEVHAVDDSLIKELQKLLRAHAYLNEDIIGIHFLGGELASFPSWGIIVLHHFQASSLRPGQKADTAVVSLIKKSVIAGALRPEICLNWLELQRDGPKLFTRYFALNDTLRRFKANLEPTESKLHIHDLMYDTCNFATGFIQDYYLDNPANMIRKLLFNYRKYSTEKYIGKDIQSNFILIAPYQNWGESKSGNNEMIYKFSDVVAY